MNQTEEIFDKPSTEATASSPSVRRGADQVFCAQWSPGKKFTVISQWYAQLVFTRVFSYEIEIMLIEKLVRDIFPDIEWAFGERLDFSPKTIPRT